MKEIKFRGFGIFEWVYGFLVKDSDKCYIVGEVETSNDYGEGTDLYAVEWYEVTPESVGQYTGLKDKHGKEIYENDLIAITDPFINQEAIGVAEIIFSHDYVGGWVAESKEAHLNIGTRTHMISVVGNRFENPELLKEEVK